MEEFSSLSQRSIEYLIGFAISTGIGFLIGLEREFSKGVKEAQKQFAGVRTFTMISIFGFLSALMASELGNWFFGIALFSLVAFVIVSYIGTSRIAGNTGTTSEIASIITFLLGGLVFMQFVLLALAIMIVVLLLLTYKPSLHLIAKNIKKEELLAIIFFVIISALVIPFLPDKNFGPYGLWNLQEIWKMVILVSGTSLVGYMIARIMGNKGTLIAGMVGGLVSSTSVALTFSRRSKEAAALSSYYYAIGIIAACTIMFPRILFEVYVVNAPLTQQLWIPVLLFSIAGFGTAFLIFKLKKEKAQNENMDLKNPLDFSTAIKFALIFAAVQWLVKFAGEKFGSSGTYIAGIISGITDVDAITLSMAKMSGEGDTAVLAINTILLAALSNTLVKFIIVLALGSSELRKMISIGFIPFFIVGLGYFAYTLLF